LLPLVRTEPWDSECPRPATAREDVPSAEPVWGEGEPPPGLFDRERAKHGDVQVSSFIDAPLWDKAKWRATFFGFTHPGAPPLFGLAFTDKDAAVAIFSEWRRRLGEVDQNEELRISVLTGIDKANPASYRVIVSAKPRLQNNRKLTMIAVRSNTMTPHDSKNLSMFLEAFARVG